MNIQKTKLLLFIAILNSLLFSSRANSDEYHYKNILIGERPAGMAGAYTAISDDPAGLYYNPAGVVFVSGMKISASANAFYTTSKSYDNVLGSFNWDRESSSLLPNFFGIVQPVGRGFIGLSYAVPDSIIEDQDQDFSNITATISEFTINFNKQDNTYLFGPSYALVLREGLSIGVTLYYHLRRKKIFNNQHVIYNDTTTYTSTVIDKREEKGLRPILGIMWSPPEANYSLGLAVTRTFIHQENIFIQVGVKPRGSATALKTKVNWDIKREYPWNITLGGAYFYLDNVIFSGDISYNTSVSDDFGDRRAVTNFAVGTEYYPSSKVALRGGFYTNLANTEPISVGDTGKDENIDMYGLSASYSFFTKSTSLTLGMVYSFGSGKAQVSSVDTSAIQNVNSSSMLVFIGTSYAF